MAVKLRLNRIGTKKRPYYRIVAIDSRKPKNGRFIEILGTYDPMNISVAKDATTKQEKGLVNLNLERVKYWLSVGAIATPTMKTIIQRASKAA